MPIDIDMVEITTLFIEECEEGLEIMENGLMELDLGAADVETMNAIFRAAHSIKGGGATFGFTEISEFAHHLETLLDQMRTGALDVSREAVDILLTSTDCIKAMIEGLATGEAVGSDLTEKLVHQLNAVMEKGNPAEEGSSVAEEVSTSTEVEASPIESTAISGYNIHFKPSKTIFQSTIDPIKVIQDLELLGELNVTLENGDSLDFETMNAEECYLSWSFILTPIENNPIEVDQIKEVFAWVEDECELTIEVITSEQTSKDGPHQDDIADLEPEAKPQNSDASVEAQLSKPVPSPAKSSNPETKKVAAKPKDNSSIRVNIDKVDALINLVGELVITQSMLSRFNTEYDVNGIDEGLREGLQQLSRNTRELQESVMAIRLLPISSAFNRFTRLVRDTSERLGKKINLVFIGENTEIDKTVLEKIADPLVHLVRNSLDHGLETSEERLKVGKSAEGTLTLNAYHEGGFVVIEVIDDGNGINQEKVLAKAREKGIVKEDEELSPEQINDLIFAAGFSTADEVSDLSGRGVGMDVVRKNISELGGKVTVMSEPGVGSTFTIRLPLTLAILDGQLVKVGKECYIIPIVSIIETVQPKHNEVNAIAGQTELFNQRGEYLPILRLHELFSVQPDSSSVNDGLLVVAESNGERVGIFVDNLLDQQQIVIKSLESNYQQVDGISGATILGDGQVALILDVPGLLQLFYSQNKNIVHTSSAVQNHAENILN